MEDSDKTEGSENTILKKVTRYCMENWMPVSRHAKDNLISDLFLTADLRTAQEIAPDLKLDLALYTLFLQYLCEDPPTPIGRPIKGLNQLPDLFSRLTSIRSRFKANNFRGTENLSENEATTLAYAVTASTTTEALAATKGVDAEVGFMFGLLRQLGLMLIAFNYPTVLKEALEYSRKGTCTLHEGITNMLGVSPAQLGYEVLSHWEVSEEIKVALTASEALPNSHEMKILFDCSNKAERLAQTELAPDSPTFLEDRQSILDEIEKELGKQGLFTLTQNITERLYTYVQERPELFEKCSSFAISLEEQGGKLFMENEAAQECPQLVRNYFLSAYKSVEEGKPSPFALTTLITTVLPKIGFSRGCLYILDADCETLLPKLILGEKDKQEYIPLSTKLPEPQYLGVIQALTSYSPITEKRILMNGRRLSHISGQLQQGQEKTVLFLEIDKELQGLSSKEILQRFHGVRQALIDFLHLPQKAVSQTT